MLQSRAKFENYKIFLGGAGYSHFVHCRGGRTICAERLGRNKFFGLDLQARIFLYQPYDFNIAYRLYVRRLLCDRKGSCNQMLQKSKKDQIAYR